jgi:hypothetical protein
MKRLVEAFESRSMNTNKSIASFETDPVRVEVAAQLQQVIEDGSKAATYISLPLTC